MREQLTKRFERTNSLFLDAVEAFGREHLDSKLGDLPSNAVGAQYWCVVGARESYLRAAKSGEWRGFTCRLAPGTRDPETIASALRASHDEVSAFLVDAPELSEVEENWMLDLLEHEVQHHGQLIRYLYGLRVEPPQSWIDRYALD